MKKITIAWKQISLILLVCIFAIPASGCSEIISPQPEKEDRIPSIEKPAPNAEQAEKAAMRKIAWDSLSHRQRESMEEDWQKAEVANLTGNWTRYGIAIDNRNTKIPDRTIQVTFRTIQDSMLGPLVIYIDPETKKRVGVGIRE